MNSMLFLTQSLLVSLTQIAANTSSQTDDEVYMASLTAFSVVYLIVGIIYYIIYAVFLMKLFAKANVPAWKAWVPFVNMWKFFELGGYYGALSLLLYVTFIPYVGWIAGVAGFIISCMAAYQIGLKNSKSGAWVVLYIFLSIVWVGILGLGQSTWNDSLGKRARGPEIPPSSIGIARG